MIILFVNICSSCNSNKHTNNIQNETEYDTSVIKTIDSYSFTKDHWYYQNSHVADTTLKKLIGVKWSLICIRSWFYYIDDTIYKTSKIKEVVKYDTANSKTYLFNSDYTCQIMEINLQGKWKIVDNKYLFIMWNSEDSSVIDGMYNIMWLQNEGLHLFKGTNKIPADNDFKYVKSKEGIVRIGNKYVFKKNNNR